MERSSFRFRGILVSPEGIEPSTCRLKADRSTHTELRARDFLSPPRYYFSSAAWFLGEGYQFEFVGIKGESYHAVATRQCPVVTSYPIAITNGEERSVTLMTSLEVSILEICESVPLILSELQHFPMFFLLEHGNLLIP